MTKDYYNILGVARNASKDEVKRAYRKLAHQHHPDKKGGDEARFKEINEAYRVLSDDQKRAQYDQYGRVFEGGGSAQQGGFEWPGGIRFDFGAGNDGFDFSEIFEDFLGGMSGGRSRTRERKGKDIRVDMEISFEEAIFGTKREIELSKLTRCQHCAGSGGEPGSSLQQCQHCQGNGNVRKTQRTILGSFTQVGTCPVCMGTGEQPEKTCTRCRGNRVEQSVERIEVFIPKSIREGEVLKITGKGEASATGGIPGDLYINISVRPHKVFRRQGDDIVMVLPVKLTDAIMGGAVDVEALDGPIRLKVPEGMQSGDILKVRGKGAYLSNGYGRGNLLIESKVEIPRKISRKTRHLVEELRGEGL